MSEDQLAVYVLVGSVAIQFLMLMGLLIGVPWRLYKLAKKRELAERADYQI